MEFFSGSAADMLKSMGAAVPDQQPMTSLVDAQDYQRMKALWKEMLGGDVETRDEDKVNRSELDPWQAFGHDTAMASVAERERLLGEPGRSGGAKLKGFNPLRLLLSGGAGTGKSRCVRAIVSSLREKLVDSGRSKEVWGMISLAILFSGNSLSSSSHKPNKVRGHPPPQNHP